MGQPSEPYPWNPWMAGTKRHWGWVHEPCEDSGSATTGVWKKRRKRSQRSQRSQRRQEEHAHSDRHSCMPRVPRPIIRIRRAFCNECHQSAVSGALLSIVCSRGPPANRFAARAWCLQATCYYYGCYCTVTDLVPPADTDTMR